MEREPAGLTLLALLLVGIGLLLGLFPQLLTDPVAAVILPLSTLGGQAGNRIPIGAFGSQTNKLICPFACGVSP